MTKLFVSSNLDFLILVIVGACLAIIGVVILKTSPEKGQYPSSKKGKIGLVMTAIGIVMMISLMLFSTNVTGGSVGIDDQGRIYLEGNHLWVKVQTFYLNGHVPLSTEADLFYNLTPEEIEKMGVGKDFVKTMKENITVKEIYLDNGHPKAVLGNIPKGIDPNHLSVVVRADTFFDYVKHT